MTLHKICRKFAQFDLQQRSDSISNIFSKWDKQTLTQYRSSRSQMFFKIVLLKSFANFIAKLLCWSLFLIELQAGGPAILLKIDSNARVSYETCKSFKNTFFYRTPPGTVVIINDYKIIFGNLELPFLQWVISNNVFSHEKTT